MKESGIPTLFKKICLLCLLSATLCHTALSHSSPKIDPIKFSLATNATNISLNEEFEIEITASYLNIPSNTAFVFQGSNAFRLRLIFPEGFEQTGGDFTDFTSAELSSTKPFVRYTVKGKFVKEAGDGQFQLLRSHKNADQNSTYVQVATIPFKIDANQASTESNARIALVAATTTSIPYMSISQLRAGAADTLSVVFVTDNGKSGLFKYNSASTVADDGAMTIVSGARRYERVYDGPVNVSWFGVKADGTTDQSATIQTILNNTKYRNIFFPRANSAYKIRSIRIQSNTTIEFEEGTTVEGMGTLGTTEKIMYMYDVSNIVIKGYGCTFRDLKSNYSSSQHRHIFSLEGVVNVVIEGMAANDSGGDGFYIGAGSTRKVSENIKIVNVSANNNTRNGISITTAKNVDIINAVATGTTGGGPQCGIDIEPNNVENRIEGVRLTNVRTGANVGPGIMVSPGALAATDRILDVVISNHLDDGSQYGFLVSSVRNVLPGSITSENATWKNSKVNGFTARNWGYRACAVTLINPTVINSNTLGSTSPTAGAAFYVHREVADSGETNIGNIHILSPKIMDTRATKLIQRAFSFKDWNSPNNKIMNCSVIDPVKVSDFFPATNMIANADINWSDKNSTMVHETGGYSAIADYTYFRSFYTNQTSTAVRNVTLGKVNVGFPEIIFEVRSPYAITITPNATDNIMPLSSVNGKYITSKVVGSRVKLRKTLDNSWFIVEMTGTWTVQP